MLKLIICLCTIVTILAQGLHAFADETPEDYAKNITAAYGFFFAQTHSLQYIEKKYPRLSQKAKEAQYDFLMSDVMDGVRSINDIIAKGLGKNELDKLDKRFLKELNVQIQNTTEQDAINFINEVKKRAKGELPESLLKTVLRENKKFAEHPETEFVKGWRETFNTKGHSKARGLDVSLSVPKSWNMREGKRPHIVQFFSRNYKEGLISTSLLINETGINIETLPKRELEEIYTPEVMKEFLPDGAKTISMQRITLENLPAGRIICEVPAKRMDKELLMRVTMYVLFYKQYMIMVQSGVSADEAQGQTLEAVHNKYANLFDLIGNSLVINSMY